uniref:kelch-like protein 17 n=1 Tax=Styela clava TaxID=7725 RepID=UPI001939278E|nr:kelch-like protein 17 [Styela clava]
MNEAKGWVAAVENEGNIYVLGGETNNHLTTVVERYDISTNVWSMVTPMLTERSLFNAFVIDTNIYAVGGMYSSGSMEKFDFKKNQWEMIDMKNMKLSILDAVKINLK